MSDGALHAPITPLPVDVSGGGGEPPALVVLFGGTFDPVHRGHVELPVRVRDELEKRLGCEGKAWLVYVPAARSPHKVKGPEASDADRVAMLRLGIAESGAPRVGVWTDEMDRAAAGGAKGEPSYTLDTVRRARAWLDGHGCTSKTPHSESGGTQLRLLIGADQALGFHRWREPREIVRIAPPAVMVRGEVADGEGLLERLGRARFWRRDERGMWADAMVAVGRLDISATRVREALRAGDEGEIGRALARGVAEYVRGRGLYGGS